MALKRSASDISDQTIKFWQQRTGKKLSRDEAREVIMNVSGFMSVLCDWDRTSLEDAARLIRDSKPEENL
jgi:hypothetical protein